MKIEESCVKLDARHDYERRQSSELKSEFSFRSVLRQAKTPVVPAAETATETSQTRMHLMLQQLVDALLTMVSGQKCRSPGEDFAGLRQEMAIDRPQRIRVTEWQSVRREQIEEHERTEVRGCGQVRTADGREIRFDLALDMCRDYSASTEIRESGRLELKDPLVINFAGKAAELTDQRINFDLDADGSLDLVPQLAAGCGYLALDADCDGRIKDGSELFGATGQHAGDGFADLARLDADHNGWIDEADPSWAALGVWFPDGKITPLKEAGVGALNLASVDSPFGLKDQNNDPLGQIRRTGVYLGEDGSVGTVQQVDLAVDKPAAA